LQVQLVQDLSFGRFAQHCEYNAIFLQQVFYCGDQTLQWFEGSAEHLIKAAHWDCFNPVMDHRQVLKAQRDLSLR
jgi:hypothetical protein